jgi:ABC-type lipoprotein export system ATPase subunit
MPIRARRPSSATARANDALVIHGPSGTGKSQTIANIIGDHLARGERLFVWDKRTAIDVVKYRLEALSLGALCGVVHHPGAGPDRTLLRHRPSRSENY